MNIGNIWFENMQSLKAQHSSIASLINNKTVAYIDIPVHFNVGDLLIYLGTEAFFRDYNINVIYRSDARHIDESQLSKVDVILFHGGGNFGDLYDSGGHQKLREKIIKKFKSKKIICLPQTIHFNDIDKLYKSAALFREHPDFYFYVRDQKSLLLAEEFTKNAFLLPDMAHSLHPLVDILEVGISDRTPKRIINLIREDSESSNKKATRNVNKYSFDWEDIINVSERYIKVYYMILSLFSHNKAVKLWELLSRSVVFRSINFFHAHDIIYTDRLHGVILGSLLGKQVFMFDNSYGKNSSYYELWLKNNKLINVCEE